MSYGSTPLGNAATTLLLSAGANAIVPGSGAFVAGGSSLLGKLFAGGADQARHTRVSWTLEAANQGSPLAAAIIMAAPRNVGGNEAPDWRAALAKVDDEVLAAAQARYPEGYWPQGQPDFYTDVAGATHQQILHEVQAAGGQRSSSSSSSSSISAGGVRLPAMVSEAGYNYTPYIVGGVALLGLAYVATRPRSRGRRR